MIYTTACHLHTLNQLQMSKHKCAMFYHVQTNSFTKCLIRRFQGIIVHIYSTNFEWRTKNYHWNIFDEMAITMIEPWPRKIGAATQTTQRVTYSVVCGEQGKTIRVNVSFLIWTYTHYIREERMPGQINIVSDWKQPHSVVLLFNP